VNLPKRLLLDEAGQDVVEYALLTAGIALAGLAGFDSLRSALRMADLAWQVNLNGLADGQGPPAS